MHHATESDSGHTTHAATDVAANLACESDPRRDAVRRRKGRNGIDYVEVGGEDAPQTLYVNFLGKLPKEFTTHRPGIARYLAIEGGESITGLKITDAQPHIEKDPERDDVLVLTLDRVGDFSKYTLRLIGVEGIDPRYDRASFAFRICCGSDLDCKPDCGCEPAPMEEPRINYLAKDYATFRQLILDRFALLMPDWTERHVPDLGLTLVELLAYVGDQLSYYQDAVATEAYLGTARQRVSVRRHARLVDYTLHEGCNARAWLHFSVKRDLDLPSDAIAFVTGLDRANQSSTISLNALDALAAGSFEYYEPLLAGPARKLHLPAAHSDMSLYAWGRRECCLRSGATNATLLDRWQPPAVAGGEPTRALNVQPGDVLIFEEVLGPKTGAKADADPLHRCAVRVTEVRLAIDDLYPVTVGEGSTAQTRPTPVVEIRWAAQDALPFALCLSTIGAAPACKYLVDVTIVHGNVIVIDHGRSCDPAETLPTVPTLTGTPCCECEDEPGDVKKTPGRYRPPLSRAPLVHAQRLPARAAAAAASLVQDPRLAVPSASLKDDGGAVWSVKQDLLASGPDDRDFVAEIDNFGVAHLRFGDGELGRQPDAGGGFSARYRVGGGVAGNVGAEAISGLVLLKGIPIDDTTVTVRNPLPARGGIDPEPIEEARLFAPAAFRKTLQRAIVAADYAEIAERNAALQDATATLAWTGSWYEANVSIDPRGTETAAPTLRRQIAGDLHRYRRMGHDLRVLSARYVPLKLTLSVCALPGHDRGHVKAALLARLGNRAGSDGKRGFFHPDELTLGSSVRMSRIIAAAQAVAGVECVTVTEFHRLFAQPNRELQNGVLTLASNEIAQLDNDPNHPERGQLQIDVAATDRRTRMDTTAQRGALP